MREPFINIAIEAARNAGNIIFRAYQRPDTIKVAEKAPNNFVTDVDQRAEREIINLIRKAYPSHAILGEESGRQAGDDYEWIIDPIDGTRNFLHGYPHFAVSIALAYKQRVEHAVVYDPLRQELFTASRGKGAQLNERRIRVGARKQLSEALLGSGFAYRHSLSDESYGAKILQGILPICGDIRRSGSVILDLAYVACGRLDGFWETSMQPWDLAAGLLLVREAGGMIADPLGGENYQKSGDIVAANPAILKQMLRAIKPCLNTQN